MRLCSRIWKNQYVLPPQELGSFPELQPRPLGTFVWTREEAEAAWKTQRTERNLGAMLSADISSVQYFSGGFMVDGIPATVTVCRNEWVKQQIVAPSDKVRFDRHQDRLERQKWGKAPQTTPIEGRTCAACGGKLVMEILNYYCEYGTDVISPADTSEQCLSCGRLTVSTSPGPERRF